MKFRSTHVIRGLQEEIPRVNERKKLREKTIEINIKLVKKRKEPLRKSQIAHIIINNGLDNIYVSKTGEILVNNK